MTLILGINAFHANSSACLLKNGEIIFAIEEERINRIKNWAGFPKQSIQMCLDYMDININEIDFIGINKNFKANIKEKIFFSLSSIENFKYALKKYKNIQAVMSLEETFIKEFKLSNLKPKIINVNHHVAHMASSCLTNSFKDSALLSLDGFGDFVSCSIGTFSNHKINIKNKIFYPHSLGILYQSITQLLGFKNYGDEYKIMGISAYGSPRFDKQFNELISYKNANYKLNEKFFSYFKKGLNFDFLNEQPNFPDLYNNNMLKLFGINKQNLNDQQFLADIANSLQKTFEKILLSIINHTFLLTNLKNLSYSGGCAMNSLANGKILKNSNFKNLSIHQAAYDAGGAIGAAAYIYLGLFKKKTIIKSKYLGPEYSSQEIKKVIKKNNLEKNFKVVLMNEKNLIKFIVIKMQKQKIFGLFRGRLEWGARSLGNRSIIADPRGPNIKNIINAKIKLREKFRPFAPSILYEESKKWFDMKKTNEVSDMMQVLNFKKKYNTTIPAVVHEDNTGRLQTVKKKDNLFYYKLIKAFFKSTRIPMLLNTSFNINEPIVCNPTDAINCFKKSKIDYLVIENFVISRKQ